MDFVLNLFDTSDFPPRWHCGNWTDFHGWLHITSDVGVWSAYFTIPSVLLLFIWQRNDLPFRRVFFLFGAFILFCGLTHLMEAIIFWWPAYRLAGVLKFMTAIVSWITVVALVKVAPGALSMKSPHELEREIVARRKAEEALHQLNEQLEQRVQQRTADLAEANAQLAQERELYRTTLASIGDGVVTTDNRGLVTTLNSVAESLTGWSQEEARKKPVTTVFQIINEQTRQPAVNPVERALREGVTVGLANHTLLVARDGTERPIDDSAAPIRSGSHEDQILGCVLVFRDVTARRKAESDLEESRRLYLDLYEHAPDMMASVDAATGKLVQCNRTLCKVLGYSKEEILGRQVFDLYDPSSRDAAESAFKQFVETGAVHNVRLKLRCHHGEELDVSLSVSAIRDEQGRIVRSRSVWRDITEQTRALRSLAETTDRLNFVLSATGVGLWFNKWPLERLNWDERTRNLFFLASGEEPTVELFYSRLHSNDREPTRVAVENAVKEGTLYEIDHRIVDPASGEIRWCRSQGMATYGDDGKPIRFDGLNYDISPQKQQEEELRQLAARLSEADRRKDEFLATLAHELRNPLAPISQGLEIMKTAQGDPQQLNEIRDIMERQTKQLVMLVDDLLDVSRITRGKLKLRKCRVSLGDVFQTAVDTARPFIEKAGHEMHISLPQQPIALDVDPHRLAQVLSNLLSNAAKYTPEGGKIELTAQQQGSDIEVAVRDSGIGIPNDKLNEIFEMFGQLEHPLQRATNGLGIGLTLVKSLVEMHGGTIDVTSEGPDRGSEFRVRLPFAGLSPASELPLEAPREGARPSKCRVLVVDDNEAAAKLLAMTVKMLGNEVRTAADGQEAIEFAAEFLPDIILMDIGMPRMNGYEAAKRIRQQPWGKAIMLVALTGWGQDEDKKRSKEAGFDHHLVKPAESSELQRLLASVEQSD